MPYPLKPLEGSWPFTIWHEIKSILLLDSSGSNDGWKSESVYFPVDDGHSLMADATDVKRAHFCWFWIVLPCASARERRKLGKKGRGGAAVSRKCSKDQEKLSVGPVWTVKPAIFAAFCHLGPFFSRRVIPGGRLGVEAYNLVTWLQER